MQVNAALDQLAAVQGEGRLDVQANVLRLLTNNRFSPRMMAWLSMIILKSVKIGVGATSIFTAWHADAQAVYDRCMSLRPVFNELLDKSHVPRRDLVPGTPIRPQLLQSVHSFERAFQLMHAKDNGAALRPFVIETKFDGERMQVHVIKGEAPKVSYFSRRGIEHGMQSSYAIFDAAILAQVQASSAILDGEFIVWNKTKGHFEAFGSLKPVVNAARDCSDPSSEIKMQEGSVALADVGAAPLRVQDVELVFVAFDIIYYDGHDVSRKPLSERHKILGVVVPVTDSPVLLGLGAISGRVKALLPDVTSFRDTLCSRTGSTLEDIKSMFDQMETLKEEGIVVKALDSQWVPNARGDSWLRMKPDYFKELEIDVAVIGGWYGENRRSGALSSYLCGVVDSSQTFCKWKTFCKVATGLDDAERELVHKALTKDEPNVIRSPDNPPDCYIVTGRERPDVWFKNPASSLVLQVQADLRAIPSQVYAAVFGPRFPRISTIRWDKTPEQANTAEDVCNWAKAVREEEQLVKDKEREAMARGQGQRDGPQGRKRRAGAGCGKGGKKPRNTRALVPSARAPDLSEVNQESSELAGCVCFFANYGKKDSLEEGEEERKTELQGIVKRLGGSTAQFDVAGVTHFLAGDPSGYKFNMWRKDDRDVITLAWLRQCAHEGRRVALRPRHYLNMSRATFEGCADMDSYGDAYFSDADEDEVRTLLLHCRGTLADVHPEDLTEDLEGASPDGEEGGAVEARGQLLLRQLLRQLDAELAQFSLQQRELALLHGCSAVLLRLPEEANEPALAGGAMFSSTLDWQRAAQRAGAVSDAAELLSLGLLLGVQGGELSASVSRATTHLIVLGPPGLVAPADLLAAVAAQAGSGAGVRALCRGLEEGRLHLVTSGWLTAMFDSLEADQGLARLPLVSEHALHIQEGLPLRYWDWKPYEAAPAGRRPPSALAGDGVAQPAAGQAQEAPKIHAPKRRRGSAIKK